jgi:DnaK suppressor protein
MSQPESPLSNAELKDLTARLQAKREDIVRRSKLRTAQMQEGREVHGDDMDMVDASEAVDTSSAASQEDAILMGEIEHALRKLDDGTYGLDESSGEPIGLARLRAIPWTRESIQSAEARERN